MIKLGIILIFLAELILFFNLIAIIIKFDKAVNNINDFVINVGVDIRIFFKDFKSTLQDVLNLFEKFKQVIEERKYRYSKKIIKSAAFFILLFTLRGNYKKYFISYNLLKDVYDGYKAGINLT